MMRGAEGSRHGGPATSSTSEGVDNEKEEAAEQKPSEKRNHDPNPRLSRSIHDCPGPALVIVRLQAPRSRRSARCMIAPALATLKSRTPSGISNAGLQGPVR